MIIFERDKPKNLIIWMVLFLLTQPIGYTVYLISRLMISRKDVSLKTKIVEDEIYNKLSNQAVTNCCIDLKGELFEFNKLAFNGVATVNNEYEFFNGYEDFKSDLIKVIKKANKSVLIKVTKLNVIDFQQINELLIEKAKSGVVVKLIYDKTISRKIIKPLKAAGAKVYRFYKHKTISKSYSNFKNVISVDGETVYMGRLDVTKKQLTGNFDICDCLLKIRGDIVEPIILDLHKDIVYASGKYLEFDVSSHGVRNNNTIQYVVNTHEQDLELLIIKAISSAKKSIQLQVDEFIPTESIISLLNFAINSNIEVKLMVPLRANKRGKFYATRAYAKELALLGANVYLYDGFIRFNSIIVDDEYALYGSYILDREHVATALQNIIVIKDDKAINHLNKLFNSSIDNSYRINNANFMLLREKFFKNFV